MKYAKYLALLLAVAILLSGCNLSELKDVLGDITAQAAIPFSEMEYVILSPLPTGHLLFLL